MSKNKLNDRLKSVASKGGLLPVSPPPPSHKRQDRQEAFKFGEITLTDGQKFACVILDSSDEGARIKLHGSSKLTKRVRLFIPSSGIGRNAEVRWQSGVEAGLKLLR